MRQPIVAAASLSVLLGFYNLAHAQDKKPVATTLSKPSFTNVPEVPELLGAKSLSFERTKGKIRPLRLKKGLANAVNRRKFRWLPRVARRQLRSQGFAIIHPQQALDFPGLQLLLEHE